MFDVRAAFKTFLSAEQGAITVDWTVLGAAIVGLGLATAAAVRTGAVSLGTDIETSLTGASVASLGMLGGAGAFVYELMAVDQATFDYWMSLLAGESNDSLNAGYAAIANAAQAYINAGDAYTASFYLDGLNAYTTALQGRGMDVPAGQPGLSDLVNAYNAIA